MMTVQEIRKANTTLLPIQYALMDASRKTRMALDEIKREKGQLIDYVAQHADAIRCSMAEQADDARVINAGPSMLNEPSMAKRIRRYVGLLGLAKTQPDKAASFVGDVIQNIESPVNMLFGEKTYLWGEDELNTAKSEMLFGEHVLDAILVEGGFPAALFDLYDSMQYAARELARITYEGQVFELQARHALVQTELMNVQKQILDQQASLMHKFADAEKRQTEILEQFQEQNDRMKGMTLAIRACTIISAIAAVVALPWAEWLRCIFTQ